MEDVLSDFSDSSLVNAIESNLFTFLSLYKGWSRAEFYDTPELTWSITDIPFSLFNSVFKARLTSDSTDDYINAAVARCQSRNVPMLWWTGPSDQPSNINSRLADHGFHISEAPGMAADLNSLAEKWDSPEKLALKRVGNDEELQIWCRTLCAAIGAPDFVTHAFFDFYRSLGFDPVYPYHNYLGSLEGEAVATSSLLLSDGVAGIYNVATRREARRKGIGTAMTAAPLGEARSLGYRVGILHSAGTGYNVYHSLGFQEYCKLFLCNWQMSEKT